MDCKWHLNHLLADTFSSFGQFVQKCHVICCKEVQSSLNDSYIKTESIYDAFFNFVVQFLKKSQLRNKIGDIAPLRSL